MKIGKQNKILLLILVVMLVFAGLGKWATDYFDKDSTVVEVKIIDTNVKKFTSTNIGSRIFLITTDGDEISLSQKDIGFSKMEEMMLNNTPLKFKVLVYESGKKTYTYIPPVVVE